MLTKYSNTQMSKVNKWITCDNFDFVELSHSKNLPVIIEYLNKWIYKRTASEDSPDQFLLKQRWIQMMLVTKKCG